MSAALALEVEPPMPDLRSPDLDFSALDRLPKDTDLPYSDGVPMDNWWHGLSVALLIESIECHWQGRNDFFVGGDMFMYFSTEQVFNRDFRGPDFFVVRGVDRNRQRNSWVSWHEGGRLPNVIIELVSESSAHVDRVEKRQFYGERFRVPEYFHYDPATDEWTGYRLDGSGYEQPLPVEDGRIWSRELGLFLGTWTGPFHNHVRRWPRFFDKNGTVVPIFAEAARVRADAEQQRADAEQDRADAEQQKAEGEKQRADAERQRADSMAQELASMKAELERLKNSNP